jgi:hypothetical protein
MDLGPAGNTKLQDPNFKINTKLQTPRSDSTPSPHPQDADQTGQSSRFTTLIGSSHWDLEWHGLWKLAVTAIGWELPLKGASQFLASIRKRARHRNLWRQASRLP